MNFLILLHLAGGFMQAYAALFKLDLQALSLMGLGLYATPQKMS